MSEVARHWRLRGVRLRLEGYVDENGNPQLQNRPKPIRDLGEVSVNGNGHREENPFEQKIIYEAPSIEKPVRIG